jgi:hypothetical protein
MEKKIGAGCEVPQSAPILIPVEKIRRWQSLDCRRRRS